MDRSDDRLVPHITLVLAFAGALLVMAYSFSSAPKGPLEDVLPGSSAYTELAPTTDQFMADHAALQEKVARVYRATPAVASGPPR